MKVFILLFLSTFLALPSIGQQLLQGKIRTETGLPLAGASVRLKNSKSSAVSGQGGSFTINVALQKDTLLVSYVGYQPWEQTVSLPLESPLLITLNALVKELEAVTISTGYYQVPAERVTGSFTQIDQETFNRSNSTDVLGRLKGNASSILFDERNEGKPAISVRGLSTIYAAREPLIVLNNFPYEGDINNINPNDVESVTILKDAAAASIWGVRAANGVIVITTKKGKAGKTPELSFNSTLTLGNKPDVYYNPGLSSTDFIGVEEYLFNQGFYEGMEADPAHPALTPAVELFIARRDGVLSSAEADARLQALGQQNVRDDFNKYVYQNSINQQYALNLTGGTDFNSYYLSAGYDRNAGYTAAVNDRFTVRADQTFSVGEKLKLKPSITYSTTTINSGREGINSIRPEISKTLFPYARLADENGKPLSVLKDLRAGYVQGMESAGLLNWQYVPLENYKSQNIHEKQSNLLLNMGLDYHVSKTLTAKLQYQYENSNNGIREFKGEESYFARDMINRFTQDDGSGSLTFQVPRGGIVDLTSGGMSAQTGRGQVEYTNTWGKHSLDALSGAEIRQIHDDANTHRTYGYIDDGLISAQVNYLEYFPMYHDSGDYQPIPASTDFIDQTNRYTAFYANAAYTFDKRYIVSLSGRKDASNLFGVRSNQKGVPLWSAGVGWNIHHEQFFRAEWLDLLKLRLTYGYNGNLDRNLAAVATIYQLTGNMNNRPYGLMRSFPNPELSWETVGVFNAGIDFGLKNKVLNGSLEYYIKRSNNLIGDQPIDPTVGLMSGTIRRNVAGMVTRGFDLQLHSKNIDRDFKWNTSLLFSYNNNELTDYYTINTLAARTYISSGNNFVPVIGKPVYNVISYPWAGLDPVTGGPRGYLKGEPSSNYRAMRSAIGVADLQQNGSALPRFFGNAANSFSYAGFSLYVNLSYRLGYVFRRESVNYDLLYNKWKGHQDFAERWQKPGDELNTNVPAMVYPAVFGRDEFYTNSSILVEKGDNIRLQNVNLSYRLGGKNLRSMVKDMELYTNAHNLGFIWRSTKSGVDPDFGSGYLPPSFDISFGIRTNF